MKRNIYWIKIMVVVMTLVSATVAIGEQLPPPPPIIPQVSANPSNLTADGVSTAIITAVSVDGQGKPQVGVNAYFYLYPEGMGNLSTTLGYVEGKGWLNITDSNGRAMAIFTAGKKAGNETVVAVVGDGGYAILKLEDTTSPSVISPSANPGGILLEEPNNADFQHMSTTLSVTATDASGVAGVIIDLSSIGGSATAVMTPVGGSAYSITTNATGTSGAKSLRVNATDIFGNSNTTLSISLNVLRNGDINGDGNVNSFDVTYLARTLSGIYPPANPLVADVSGDGNVNSFDVTYLSRYLNGIYNVLK